MSSETNSTNSNGVTADFLLFLTFLILKLTHVIGWSWWWVTLPLWGGFVFVILIVLIALIVTAFVD